MTKPTKSTAHKKGSFQSSPNEALQARLARALADYSNLEKRFSRDSSSVIKFANANLLMQILAFRDHLEMATTSLKDPSLTMLLAELDKILVSEGVVEINTSGPFDPTKMECGELGEGPKDQIIRTTRRGYILHERVLQPAIVVVGMGDKK
ncbi:MAG: nucleotide exchange factor GrpE [bacterium]